jgi:CHAT domain-containing protein
MRRALALCFLFTLQAQQDLIEQGTREYNEHRYNEASATFNRALQQAAASANRLAMGNAYLGLGRAEWQLNRMPASRAAFEAGLAIGNQLGDKPLVADLLRGLSNVYRPMGLLPESKDAAERARALYGEIGNAHHATGMLISLALTTGEMGDMQTKGALLRQCLREIDANHYDDLVSTVLIDLGVLYFDQGDYERGLEYALRAIKIVEALKSPDYPNLSRAYANVAISLARLGRDQEALRNYDIAIERARAGKDEHLEMFTRWNRAFFHRVRSNPKRALEDLRPAVAYYLNSGHQTEAISVQAEFVHTLIDAGLTDEAAPIAAKLVTEARNYTSPRALIDALNALGNASLNTGRFAESRAAFEGAITLIESARVRLAGAASDQQNYLSREIYPYHGMLQLLAREGNTAAALEYSERAKARLLVDLLSAAPQVTAAMTTDEKQRERVLAAEVERLDAKIEAHDPAALTEFQHAADALDSFRSGLYRSHPTLRLARAQFQPVTAQEASGLLPDGATAILEYAVLQDRAWVFAITRDGTTMHAVPQPASIGTNVERFRRQLESRDPAYKETAAQLWRQTMAPVAATVRGKKLIVIVPDGQLWNLPFQALISPAGRHLLEDSVLFYAPSLTALREVRRRPASNAAHDLLALSGAGQDVHSLAELYGKSATVFTGPKTDKEQWKSLAPDYRILHVATHGVLNGSAPLYSYLELAGDDERLTAREILDLHLNADLAVLSACETARGNFHDGEGLIGMSWAFLVAGSPTTVVSQWKVDSAATAQLMLAFHRNLRAASGHRQAEALQRSALALLRTPQYRHPFYWAGFVMIGSGY